METVKEQNKGGLITELTEHFVEGRRPLHQNTSHSNCLTEPANGIKMNKNICVPSRLEMFFCQQFSEECE